MIKKYCKKPVEIEAIQWTGENTTEVNSFVTTQYMEECYTSEGRYLLIYTLEGAMKANIGDYIIKGVKGEFYPCKPDIFNETYNEVE